MPNSTLYWKLVCGVPFLEYRVFDTYRILAAYFSSETFYLHRESIFHFFLSEPQACQKLSGISSLLENKEGDPE